ncbi:uncharacterized protein N7515_004652 [Penicillium bovifimosum]|uniref:Uncharacterized protein n=1 Tax=Penicillium bovifimosum TaxID=126998 RepID=A0A9W9L471_9EURO|nr:uncharacterized protein N7515_004652 [Penicillium bovifimosum]KAJ5135374.1 hypothetical protein N7515_004652 [Penicillium bovifimosum]
MDEIAEIVREIGRQQGENAYYRSCYESLKRLQDLVAEASDDLSQLYQHNTYKPPCDIRAHQVADGLRRAIDALILQERKAQLALSELYTF